MVGFGNTPASSSSEPRAMGSSMGGGSSTSQGQYTYVQSSRAIGRFVPNSPADEELSDNPVSTAAAAVVDFIRSKVSGGSSDAAASNYHAHQHTAPALPRVGSDGGRFVKYQQHLLNPDGLQHAQPMGGWVEAEVTATQTLVDELLAGSPTPTRAEINQAVQSIVSSPAGAEPSIQVLCSKATASQTAMRWQPRLRALILLDALRQHAQSTSYLASREFAQQFTLAFSLFAVHKSVQDRAQLLWTALYGPETLSPLQRELARKAEPSLFEGLAATADTDDGHPGSSPPSLFGSLSLSSDTAPSVSTATSPRRPNPAAQSGSSSADLLLNFGVSDAAPGAPTQPSGHLPSKEAAPLFDLAGLNFPAPLVAQSQQPPKQAHVDQFSFLEEEFKRKDSPKLGGHVPQPAAPQTTPGSSFDFL